MTATVAAAATLLEPVRALVGVRRHPDVPEELRIPDDNLERIFRRMDSLDGRYDDRIETARLAEVLAVLDRRRGSEQYQKALREVT